MRLKTNQSLCNPEYERDACGVGFVANVNGGREPRSLAYAGQALGNLAGRLAPRQPSPTTNPAWRRRNSGPNPPRLTDLSEMWHN
ncbi:MAG: hypothetical protein KGJ60_07270 [Verrucomicrobiota bacterium]|nr:hypothetical protein [Verrucomicrobiota bacterium]